MRKGDTVHEPKIFPSGKSAGHRIRITRTAGEQCAECKATLRVGDRYLQIQPARLGMGTSFSRRCLCLACAGVLGASLKA
jgi:hypothetical protein